MDNSSWRRILGTRLEAQWRLKLLGIPVFIAVFFAGYFFTLGAPLFPAVRMPLTGIDRAIGFHPSAMPLYLSLWVYVIIPPALIENRAQLKSYGLAAGGLALVGLAIFLFWPTAVPDPGIDWLRYPAFSQLKAIDASGNACPSLHVAFAVFSAIWIHRLLWRMGDRGWLRGLSWCWCLGILYSTLATKQHVAVDVLAGAALGGIGSICHPREAGQGN